MNGRRGVILILAAGLLTGCLPSETYEIEMRAQSDGKVRRTLEGAQIGFFIEPESQPATNQPTSRPGVSPQWIAKSNQQSKDRWIDVIKAYDGNPTDAISNGPVHLKGSFDTKLPFDIGNHGYVLNYTSRLGRFVMYGEHFRGSDTPAEQIEQRLKAVDRLTGFLIGWFDLEFAGDPELPKLRNFLDKTFRKDAKNIAIYLWRSDSLPREEREDSVNLLSSLCGRVGVYLLHEGYLGKQDLAHLATSNPSDTGVLSAPLLKTILAKARLRDDGLGDKVVDLLTRPDKIQASLEQHAEALMKKGVSPRDRPKGESESEALWQCFLQAFGFRLDIFGMGPILNVTFHCPVEPDFTNGQWDPKKKTITWHRIIGAEENSDLRMPTGLYAIWTAPDEEAQKRLLPSGRAMDKDDLKTYCLWRATLTDAQAKLYDAHLDAVAKAGDKRAIWDRFFKAHGKEPRFDFLRELIAPSP